VRELDKELPKIDEGLVTIKGHVTFLERKLHKLKTRESELTAKVQAAEARGAATAATYEVDLEGVRIELAGTDTQLSQARVALEKAEAVKRAYVEQKAAQLASAREQLDLAEGHAAPPPPPPADDDGAPPRVKVSARGETSESGGSERRKTIGPDAALPTERPRPPVDDEAEPVAKTMGPAPERSSAPKTLGEPDDGKTIGPQTQPAAEEQPGGHGDLVAELERLGKLLSAGALTQEEFAAAKAKLLEG
jgi:hypothetical protein